MAKDVGMSSLGGWLFGIAAAIFVTVVLLLVVLAFSDHARRGRVRRVVKPLVGLWTVVTIVWLALSPVWSADDVPDYEETFDVARIEHYDADFRLDANGDLAVTERLHVNFPVSRHGIFRFFDVVDPSAPSARRLPEKVHIARDGRPEAAERSTRDDGRFVVYRIGDPAVEIGGEHDYSISYRIRGVIEPGTTGERSQVYWNLIPGGWTMPIDTAHLALQLPVKSSGTVQCAVGPGTASGCVASGAGTRHLTVRTGALPERTPVTIKAENFQFAPTRVENGLT
jgi:hypothetical protein